MIQPFRIVIKPSLASAFKSRLRYSGVTAINSAISFFLSGTRTRAFAPAAGSSPEAIKRLKSFASLVRAEQQKRENGALLQPAEHERLAVGGEHLERAQDPELGHVRVLPRHRTDYERQHRAH